MSLPWTTNVDMLTGTSPAENSIGVTTPTVGAAIDVSKRQQITVQFIGTITSGNGNFSLDVSNDGKNWVQGVAFLDALATGVGTYVVSKGISSITPFGAAVITPGFRYIRCRLDVSGTGTYYAILEAAG